VRSVVSRDEGALAFVQNADLVLQHGERFVSGTTTFFLRLRVSRHEIQVGVPERIVVVTTCASATCDRITTTGSQPVRGDTHSRTHLFSPTIVVFTIFTATSQPLILSHARCTDLDQEICRRQITDTQFTCCTLINPARQQARQHEPKSSLANLLQQSVSGGRVP